METVAVLDFETTGLSPSWGDRPTEIAVALLSFGQVVDRYQSLMNPGRDVPRQVTELAGITNEMVSNAPSVENVMRQGTGFVGRHHHNLGTLVDLLGPPKAPRAHRAMADVEMAAHLWCRIERDLRGSDGVRTVTHDLLSRLQRTPCTQMCRVLDLCG